MARTPLPEVHVLGIRHHGPGSARSVAQALAHLRPDRVLVEGAPELNQVIDLMGRGDMVPPVAGVVYAMADPRRSAFYPFAEYSPEWVAVRWALRHQVPVGFIDLPLAQVLAQRPQEPDVLEAGEETGEGAASPGSEPSGEPVPEPHGAAAPADLEPTTPEQVTPAARVDPLARLAAIAGYSEPERWWEDVVEQRFDTPGDRFSAISEAMAQVRATTPEDAENEQREAAMRQQIRAAIKQMTPDQRLVVVCGAWHAPALHPETYGPATRDSALLKGLPKVKVAAAWAPWTSERLASGSGYGAGVQAPGWYQHLFRHAPLPDLPLLEPDIEADAPVSGAQEPVLGTQGSAEQGPEAPVVGPEGTPGPSRAVPSAEAQDATTHRAPADAEPLVLAPVPPMASEPASVAATWLVRVARTLRRERIDASTASIVEATRLAEALAALRGRPTPGLDELDEACVAVLTEGHWAPLAVVHRELTVGHAMGRVPHDAPIVPLAADLAAQQKSLRMKVTPTEVELTVDLRQPSHLAKSVLLHRLEVLEVPWALQVDAGATAGTFKEAWTLRWEPESVIALVLANQYGSTVRQAAATKLAERAETATTLAELSQMLGLAMRADLPVTVVLERLAARAAEQHDAAELLGTVEPLAQTCRYGDVRGLPTDTVREVIDGTVRRALVGLPMACAPLGEEAAETMRGALDSAQRGLAMLHDSELVEAWHETLAVLARGEGQPGTVAGRAARLLLDAASWDVAEVARVMSRRLSPALPPAQAAAWLEAFLTHDATLLLADDVLLSLVDTWLSHLQPEVFEALLPLVRRSFSAFTASDRHDLGRSVTRLSGASGGAEVGGPAPAFDLPRTRTGLGATARLLTAARRRTEAGAR